MADTDSKDSPPATRAKPARRRGRSHAAKLLKTLAGKSNILITTHRHPDPDALASSLAMRTLLSARLKEAKATVAVEGRVGGGINSVFAKSSEMPGVAGFDDLDLKSFDAIVLLDTQPHFANSPLPADVPATVVIDHHRSLGRRPKCGLCDIRSEVGATASIIFSYFMELEVPISGEMGAMLLYAIESDLAGAAGAPGDLDNLALSSLTLLADPRKLYRMRYVDLPRGYYIAYARGLNNAQWYDRVLTTFLEKIQSPEEPAILADFLLRFDQVEWALASGINDQGKLVLSMRTSDPRLSAADVMQKMVRGIGDGGGHRAKAGGSVPLTDGSEAEITRVRALLRKRLLRAVKAKPTKPQWLVPR